MDWLEYLMPGNVESDKKDARGRSRMFSGKKQGEKREGTVIGYDLGEVYSQISYWSLEKEEPETVSAVMGTQQYNIPTVICRKKNTKQWLYGKEAQKYAEEEGVCLIENLLKLIQEKEMIVVEEEEFNPIALLTIFIKRSLSLLNMSLQSRSIIGVMFTIEDTSPEMIDALNRVVLGLELKTDNVFFQTHKESMYHYMIKQPEDLWKRDVLVFDYERELKTHRLKWNPKTVPRVFFAETKEYPGKMPDKISDIADKKEIDSAFLNILKEDFADERISTAYLLGDGFKGSWMEESIRFLCRRKRVFQGNNLYSKGACYSVAERLYPSNQSPTHIYLGEEKLKANIGMKALKRGEEVYYALMDAGIPWYEAKAECEVILKRENEVTFLFTSVTGGVVTEEKVILEDLPKRKDSTTRLYLSLAMITASEVEIMIEDRGFGELVPATHRKWKKTIKIH